jgi:hypothetical protein
MRHIAGFILALITSAALFFGGGWGIAKFADLKPGQGLRAFTDLHNVLPVAALLGTGLLLGILLAVRRVSALATGLPGLTLLGWSAYLLLRGQHALSWVPMPGSRYSAGFAAMLSSGVLVLLGVAMIIPLFMPSRWRSGVTEVEEYDDDFSVPSALGLTP